MPNGRNVEKLTDALMRAARDWSRERPQAIDFLNLGMVMAFAKHLAARGVLAPSALTDDELLACAVEKETGEAPMERAEVAASIRDRLERIARGEAD
jgi:hypothetical protein